MMPCQCNDELENNIKVDGLSWLCCFSLALIRVMLALALAEVQNIKPLIKCCNHHRFEMIVLVHRILTRSYFCSVSLIKHKNSRASVVIKADDDGQWKENCLLGPLALIAFVIVRARWQFEKYFDADSEASESVIDSHLPINSELCSNATQNVMKQLWTALNKSDSRCDNARNRFRLWNFVNDLSILSLH